jgi:hypothetical protein
LGSLCRSCVLLGGALGNKAAVYGEVRYIEGSKTETYGMKKRSIMYNNTILVLYNHLFIEEHLLFNV